MPKVSEAVTNVGLIPRRDPSEVLGDWCLHFRKPRLNLAANSVKEDFLHSSRGTRNARFVRSNGLMTESGHAPSRPPLELD